MTYCRLLRTLLVNGIINLDSLDGYASVVIAAYLIHKMFSSFQI